MTFITRQSIIKKNGKEKHTFDDTVKISTLLIELYKRRVKNKMKARNINKSSAKTRAIIKKTFAEMLSEKQEINKITVTELVKRADINRGTFYSHYDDIYCVAEDYENELIDKFFDDTRLISLQNADSFVDSFFDYIRKNNENYKLLCRSNEFLFAAKKLTTIASNKFLEICNNDKSVTNKEHIALEINVFIDGLLCEYVKYCRGYSDVTPDKLYDYTKYWIKNLKDRICK